MLRSLYSAISGLKNHEIRMDVIGNNIANVNTTGFKRSRTNFATMLSQTLKGASMPTGGQARSNAAQVGFGALLGSIDQVMTQGSAQNTGRDTDLMLQGSGYFVLDNNGRPVYTRSGGFGLDQSGYLVDPATGARVMGYNFGADESAIPDWNLTGPIKISLGDKLAIDKNLPVSLSEKEIDVSSINDTAPFSVEESELVCAGNVSIPGLKMVPATQVPGAGEFSFDATTGKITFGTKPTSNVKVSYVAAFNPSEVSSDGKTATVLYPPLPGAKIYVKDKVFTLGKDPANLGENEYFVKEENGNYKITFGSDVSTSDKIGYDFNNKPHILESFTIDQTGTITGIYNDGITTTTHKIAQLAVAKFSNEAGLTNIGNSYLSISSNSGQPEIGGAGEDGRALVLSGSLEMSNVDLSQEFTDMIVTQRGFQANSRVITVSDTLLQELIDLKRQ